MLQALVITLREGVEAALIIGIVLAYLTKIGRSDLRKVVFWALGCAFAGSIGFAVLLSRKNWNEDIFEGWVMLAAGFFVITMIIFMVRTSHTLKGKIQERIGTLATRGSAIGLFLFVFLMVVREGVETVLMLVVESLNSTELLTIIGTVLGVTLAIVFGVVFVKGTVRINLQKFFRVTTVILIFVAAQLIVSGLHELSENGVLHSSRREMAMIGPIVRNDVFFSITILALAAMMLLFEQRRRAVPLPAEASNAERRKARWTARRERMWAGSVYVSSFVFILLITAQFIYAKAASTVPPATPVTFTNGQAIVPATDLATDDLHHYAATVEGHRVGFFLYKRADGKVVTVFDACEICGGQGFAKTSRGVVCKNCAAPINAASIGQHGGCNPVPLESKVVGPNIVITEKELAGGAKYFQD
jgi:high-affinity iron transporter